VKYCDENCLAGSFLLLFEVLLVYCAETLAKLGFFLVMLVGVRDERVSLFYSCDTEQSNV